MTDDAGAYGSADTVFNLRSWDDVKSLLSSEELPLRSLHALWEHRHQIPAPPDATKVLAAASGLSWLELDPGAAAEFCRHALANQEFLLAVNTSSRILQSKIACEADFESIINLRLSHAESMIRLGFGHTAWNTLAPSLSKTSMARLPASLQSRVLTVLAHSISTDAEEVTQPSSKVVLLQQAADYYRSALEIDPRNLVARLHLTLTLGQLIQSGPGAKDAARDEARRILKLRPDEADSGQRARQWLLARAVALTLLGEKDEALQSFGKLAECREITTPELAEARHFARGLARALDLPKDQFDPAFPPLNLIVFSGHLPDLPGRPRRFPVDRIDEVRAKLVTSLRNFKPRVGLASGCAGGDLLFINAIESLGGAFHLVLPWARGDFRRAAVEPYDTAGNRQWSAAFDRAVANAATIRELGQSYEPANELGWEYMMEVSAGIARNIARVYRLDLQPLVLWDGRPGRGPGGTSAFFSFWRDRMKMEPRIVPMNFHANAKGRAVEVDASHPIEQMTTQHQVKSMLFADIVGYSKLSEGVIPEFVTRFLGRVSRLIATSNNTPCSVNTWGDSIYAVFDFVSQAGAFALELTALMRNNQEEWRQAGLCADTPASSGTESLQQPLDVRIGLHTGPVFIHFDPVVRRLGYTGSHVNRAARIEPVAEPGAVFVSEEFAALLELEMKSTVQTPEDSNNPPVGEGRQLRCEYAGSMQLAKGYPGWFHIYRLVPGRHNYIEKMAEAIHSAYLEKSAINKTLRKSNPSQVEWAQLREDFRKSCRAQAADMKIKLLRLGYEVVAEGGLPPGKVRFKSRQIHEEAIHEHERWMKERRQSGWTYARRRNNQLKKHPSLVEWSKLPRKEKEKDRDVIRSIPHIVERAGLRLQHLS